MKTLKLLLLLFVPLFVKAQTWQPQYLGQENTNVIVRQALTLPKDSLGWGNIRLRNGVLEYKSGSTWLSAGVPANGTVFTGTMSQARALQTTPSSIVLTDYGGGLFVKNDTVTVDNTGTQIKTAGGQGYSRVYDGALDVTWFGAKGDGVTDDTDSIQKTLLFGRNIYIPYGRYLVSVLNIDSNQVSIGGQGVSWSGSQLKGTVIVGNIRIKGNNNTINGLGVENKNSGGNGFNIRDNASNNTIKNCKTDVFDHGILIEQYGGTASSNKVLNCDAYNGIHGFVSKADKTEFINCTAYSPSQDGFAIVSDNITGVTSPSIATNNKLINCNSFGSNMGLAIYAIDYSSTTNLANIQLNGLVIENCNFKAEISYSILVGSDASSVPSGQTYVDVRNVNIVNSICESAGPNSIKMGRCNGVSIISPITNKPIGKTGDSKYWKLRDANQNSSSLGTVVYNSVLTVNSTNPDISNGDVFWETANTATTVIGNISGGKVGQVITIFIKDNFTTIVKNNNLKIKSYIRGIGSSVTLRRNFDLSAWEEISSYSSYGSVDWPYSSDLNIAVDRYKYNSTFITGNINSFIFSNVVAGESPFKLQLRSNGIYNISGWDSRIVWLNGIAPPTTTGKTQSFEFFYDGTNIINTYRSDISRVSTSQRLAIPNPNIGLYVYDTTIKNFSYYNGSTWDLSPSKTYVDSADNTKLPRSFTASNGIQLNGYNFTIAPTNTTSSVVSISGGSTTSNTNILWGSNAIDITAPTLRASSLTGGYGYVVADSVGKLTKVAADTNVVSGAADVDFSTKGYYSFTGTTATWDLMPAEIMTTTRYLIANMGSGNLTINAPINTIWEAGTLMSNTILAPGETMAIYSNGIYWTIYN